jgi:predicted RNA binding protein with dsRBD fold (UPF0201 family)
MNGKMVCNAIANVVTSGEFSTEDVGNPSPEIGVFRGDVHSKMTKLAEQLKKNGKVVILPSMCNYRQNLLKFFEICINVTTPQ